MIDTLEEMIRNVVRIVEYSTGDGGSDMTIETDGIERSIEARSLRQFGETVRPLVGSGDDQHVVRLDPELGTEIRDDVPVAFDAHDRTAGSRADPCLLETLAGQLRSRRPNDLYLRVQRDDLLVLEDRRRQHAAADGRQR